MQTFTISDLSFTYPTETAPALDRVSLSVEAGSFTVLCGKSGCGKSTLLRQLKPILQPHGTKTGEILFEGKPLESLSQREQSARIGFVLQNLDAQLVTDKVWHELAFGLESLGLDTPTIRRRVAEIASYFGIQNWFYKPVAELSGGQKQLVNLASVMALEPSVLLLDEPTSQLDPIAATDFLSTLGRINRELGTTIILSEHRLEDALALSTNVVFMERGRVLDTGTASEVGARLKEAGSDMFSAMPVPMRIYAGVPNALSCPVTVAQGRLWLESFSQTHKLSPVPAPATAKKHEDAPAVELTEAFFRYDKDSPDVVKALSLRAYKGELLAILGGNGTGKSTLVEILTDPEEYLYDGKIIVDENCRIGYASQFSVRDKLSDRTVFEYLSERFTELQEQIAAVCEEMAQAEDLEASYAKYQQLLDRNEAMDGDNYESNISKQLAAAGMSGLADTKLHEISGGEYKLLQIMREMLLAPDLLILDEPITGLDPSAILDFYQLIRKLNQEEKVAILMVSHDMANIVHQGGKILQMRQKPLFWGTMKEYVKSEIAHSFLGREELATLGHRCGVPMQKDGIRKMQKPEMGSETDSETKQHLKDRNAEKEV